ncbi:unnamed protein product [Musa acuminata subsp. malaccensis]|uniref:(wild Malaysian banana) hypothetical protein n=1 Tax=Musa acuminata subsp. malaccensis TaxID=214687 RepID=A0A804IQ65_MUSAM|nr:unnamed protein product [Musa acuminata subsp. malaccensis]
MNSDTIPTMSDDPLTLPVNLIPPYKFPCLHKSYPAFGLHRPQRAVVDRRRFRILTPSSCGRKMQTRDTSSGF